jgi:hypothetical protein
MKHLILNILLIFIGHYTFAQEVVWQKLTPCEEGSNPDYIHSNRLIKREVINDTLKIKIGLIRNCNFNSKIELFSDKDSLILDIQNKSKILDVCLCYFEFDIKIIELLDTNQTLCYNSEKIELKKSSKIIEFKYFDSKYIFPSSAEINSTEISNQFYQDSLKIGLWNDYFDETNDLKAKAFYFIDTDGKSKLKWYVLYNNVGEIKEVCATEDLESLGLVTNCIEYNAYLNLLKTKP